MINFSEKYDRKNFQFFLKQFLPQDFLENIEELQVDEDNEYFKKAVLLGSVKSLECLVVIEVERKRSEKMCHVAILEGPRPPRTRGLPVRLLGGGTVSFRPRLEVEFQDL